MHHLLFKINFRADIYWNLFPLNRFFLFFFVICCCFFFISARTYLLFAHNYLTCRTINPHFCSHLDFTTLCSLASTARVFRAFLPVPKTNQTYTGFGKLDARIPRQFMFTVLFFVFVFINPQLHRIPRYMIVGNIHIRCYQLYFIAFKRRLIGVALLLLSSSGRDEKKLNKTTTKQKQQQKY